MEIRLCDWKTTTLECFFNELALLAIPLDHSYFYFSNDQPTNVHVHLNEFKWTVNHAWFKVENKKTLSASKELNYARNFNPLDAIVISIEIETSRFVLTFNQLEEKKVFVKQFAANWSFSEAFSSPHNCDGKHRERKIILNSLLWTLS